MIYQFLTGEKFRLLCFRRSSALLLLICSGCSGGGEVGLYPVTGTVTYQGQPVGGAMISFVGDADTRPATAISQPDGSYSLSTRDSPGAKPGSYTVVALKMASGDEADNLDLGVSEAGVDLSMEQAALDAAKPRSAPKGLLPEIYSSPVTSPLRFEVQETTSNQFDLKLD